MIIVKTYLQAIYYNIYRHEKNVVHTRYFTTKKEDSINIGHPKIGRPTKTLLKSISPYEFKNSIDA
jgi:hypothetical protein